MRKTAVMIAAALAFSFAPVADAQEAMVDGRVTRIDPAQGKITLRHGPIQKLDMDSMTISVLPP